MWCDTAGTSEAEDGTFECTAEVRKKYIGHVEETGLWDCYFDDGISISFILYVCL